jgi:hypothetical protein
MGIQPLPRRLLRGPYTAGCPWPLNFHAILCDLQPGFLFRPCRNLKPGLNSAAGPEYRWVSRNGLVLLCGDGPLEEMAGRLSHVRFQTWLRVAPPGHPAGPYGLHFSVRQVDPADPTAATASEASFATRLVSEPDLSRGMVLDPGGGFFLEFRSDAATASIG